MHELNAGGSSRIKGGGSREGQSVEVTGWPRERRPRTPRRLPTAPSGRALLQERAHSLLGVDGERILRHHELAVLVRFGLGAIDLGVKRSLAGGDGV